MKVEFCNNCLRQHLDSILRVSKLRHNSQSLRKGSTVELLLATNRREHHQLDSLQSADRAPFSHLCWDIDSKQPWQTPKETTGQQYLWPQHQAMAPKSSGRQQPRALRPQERLRKILELGQRNETEAHSVNKWVGTRDILKYQGKGSTQDALGWPSCQKHRQCSDLLLLFSRVSCAAQKATETITMIIRSIPLCLIPLDLEISGCLKIKPSLHTTSDLMFEDAVV